MKPSRSRPRAPSAVIPRRRGSRVYTVSIAGTAAAPAASRHNERASSYGGSHAPCSSTAVRHRARRSSLPHPTSMRRAAARSAHSRRAKIRPRAFPSRSARSSWRRADGSHVLRARRAARPERARRQRERGFGSTMPSAAASTAAATSAAKCGSPTPLIRTHSRAARGSRAVPEKLDGRRTRARAFARRRRSPRDRGSAHRLAPIAPWRACARCRRGRTTSIATARALRLGGRRVCLRCHGVAYILKMPNGVSAGSGAFEAARLEPSTARVSTGSMMPSSQSLALA